MNQPGQLGAQHDRLQPHRRQPIARVTVRRRSTTEDNFDTFTGSRSTGLPPLPRAGPDGFRLQRRRNRLADRSNLPAAFDGQTGVFVRFRLNSDGSNTDDGAYVDDVAVKCRTNGFNATSYGFFRSAAPRWRARTSPVPPPSCSPSSRRPPWPRSGQDPARRRQEGLAHRQGPHRRPPQPLQGGGGVDGGRVGRCAALYRRGGTEKQRHRHALHRHRFDRRVQCSPIPTRRGTTTQQRGSRIKPGAGCTRVNDTTVKCPVAGITRIILAGVDQADTLKAGTIAIPVTLSLAAPARTPSREAPARRLA